MSLSKEKDRERKRKQRRVGVTTVMSSADVRAMRKAGITPEYLENETGKISSRLYYALLRDRDAIKAHLGWYQEARAKGKLLTLDEAK